MILNRQNLISFLLHAGVLELGDVVDGELAVAPANYRNRTFRVRRGGERGFFVKQYRPEEGHWTPRSTLDVEAAVYRLAAGNERLEAVLPRFVAFDAPHQALVLEMVEGAEPLDEHYLRTRRFDPAVAARLGRSLAACHVELGRELRFGEGGARFDEQVPWILRADELDPHASRDQSAAQARVVALVQGTPELRGPLRELARGWRANGVVHGDMKWANCLLVPAREGAEPEVRIVDWEMASAGNLAWDVGGVLQSYLAAWVHSMRPAPGASPAEAAATAELSIDAMRPSLRAFADAYVEAVDVRPAAGRALVRRAVQYAGARLAQTAFEAMDRRERVSGQAVMVLQLCANLMERPDQAAEPLLGLS